MTCPDCGTALSAGACPACALRDLLFAPAAEAPEEDAGTVFGRYVLKRKIAAGGMGVVYEAADQKLKRTVALKLIRGAMFANEAEVARFTIEAEAAASLDHPHIVPIYESGRLEEQPFFTMKLIEGRSLAEQMKSASEPMPERKVATLLVKVAQAVHHAHQRGVLHRDLKPGNILLDAAGEPWLTDFGLAKLSSTDTSLTLTTDHLGTPNYMAPEIAGGTSRQASTASDVWALGVLLWEMLSGKPPFRGTGSVEIMRKIVDDEPTWPTSVRASADLKTIALRCLEKDPAKRPSSAMEVAKELDRWLRGEPIKARAVTMQERALKWVKRNPVWTMLVLAVLAGLGSGIILWQRAEHAVVSLTQTNAQLETTLRISTATRLASDARLQVNENATRALLLATESVEMTETMPGGALPEAASALTAVLQQVGGSNVSVRRGEEPRENPFITSSWPESITTNISPDSRYLISLDRADAITDGTLVALIDLRDPERRMLRKWHLFPKTPSSAGAGLVWMPNSRQLLSLSQEGKVVLWDLFADSPSDPAIPASEELASLQRPDLEFCNATLSQPNNGALPQLIAAWQSKDDPPQTLISQGRFTTNGKFGMSPLRSIPVEHLDHYGLYLSHDARWCLLRTISKTDSSWLFDLTRPELPPWNLDLDRIGLLFCSFSGDSTWMALSYGDTHSVALGVPLQEPPPEHLSGWEVFSKSGNIAGIDFSSDHQWMATIGHSGLISLLACDGSHQTLTLQLEGSRGRAIVFSPDGKWLAAGGDRGIVSLWPMANLQSGSPALPLRGLSTTILNLKFSPDSQELVASGGVFQVRHWSVAHPQEGVMPRSYPAGNFFVRNVVVSPDHAWFATTCQGSARPGEKIEDGFVVLSSVDGTHSHTLTHHDNCSTSAAFSHDGHWLATTGMDGLVKVWDFAALRQAPPLTAPPTPSFTLSTLGTRLEYDRHLAFHPRGTLYAVCGDGILFAWDLTQPDPDADCKMYSVHSISYVLPDIAISPDGKWMAIARHGWDQPKPDTPQHGNQVLLFDVSQPGDPQPITQLDANFLASTKLDFSPDSRWLAAGGAVHPSYLWDLSRADIAASLITTPITAPQVSGLGFSPDGQWLALAGSDGKLHLWDHHHPSNLRTIDAGMGLSTLAWIDDHRLLVGGDSNHVQLWETDLTELKKNARTLARRTLTEHERTRFQTTIRR